MQRLVLNTLFQEMMDHHNQEDGFRETRGLDPYWNLRPVVCTANIELESGHWVKTTLNPGSEFLMDQINSWLIRTTTTTQKFLHIYLKNKRHNWRWRILQPDQRQKQNHKEENLLIYRASFRWMKENGLILNQKRFFSLSAYEVSKKVINLLRDCQTVQREDDGAVQFWRIKNYLKNQFPQVQYWSDDRWKGCLTTRGGAKKRYQYCTDISRTIVHFRALQRHSGRHLIDPSLQDNMVIQSGFFQHIHHIGCAFNVRSIIINGLILGG